MSLNANVKNLLAKLTENMGHCSEHMRQEFAGIRTSKASPALVENIMVDYYGTQTRLKELAGITAPEARLLVIQPYDPSSVGTIEKAISQSHIGINPVNDGKILRLPIPELSEERRTTLVKQVKAKAEETRVAVRNLRRDANDIAKKAQKNSEITEDELKDMLEKIQSMTDNAIKAVDRVLKEKEDELMNL